jgi:hypothetical protein
MTSRAHGVRTFEMSPRRAAIVWSVIGALLVLSVFCAVAIPAQSKQPTWALALFAAMAAMLGVVGALIVTRQPRNTVGWLLWVTAIASFVSTMSSAYANFAMTPEGASLPGVTLVAWLGPIGFFPSLIAIVIFIPLLFPDGRYVGRRWRWVGAGGVAVVGLVLAGSILAPGPLPDYPTITNPVGFAPLGAFKLVFDAANSVGFLFVAILAIGSAFVRYRRGRDVERTQLRWFGAAAGLTVSLLVLSFVLQMTGQLDAGGLAWLGAIISLTLIPVAIGVAILRYRLYEIDRLVSRTIGWAVVTAVLIGVFATVVVTLQAVFAQLANESSLAVAASTLVAFALFQPLRRRVQRAVNRRFDRASYDGQRTVDAFAERLRNEVDLATLRSSLAATANEAVRPAGSSVWLRGGRA